MSQGDPLEKEMATHSNLLAWRIPWTDKPGGLSPWGVTKNWTRLSVNTYPPNTHTQTHVAGSDQHETDIQLGVENSNPLFYFCLENFMNRETWWATVHRVAKMLDSTEQAQMKMMNV